ncbi:hypothetical protein [Vibrio gazogenes]|uniref:Uncharacterized protein n=1 Tax=Vibrio gazogenes TaxID=687 RepID=A0A1Z2SL13_VIBGA|nr:hypothetical protein [Vibrio gazogenes]ASA57881.1 hypothetical protein BSQ33_19370 [Vibrio gazogenes]
MLLGKSLWDAVENAIEIDECYCVPNHSIINTAIGQELGRQKDVQSGISDSADRTSMNEAMGEQYARRLGQLYSSDNYSSYSETFASSLQNSSIVAQGTASANQVGDANVVYRQLHPKEVAAIHSLSDQLAQKTGMSSDKAEKLLAQVAAGRVDEKWSEVYQLDDASTADDVAAANALLDGFAEAQGKELLKDDDVVANWFSEDPESDVYKDTSLFSENLTSGVEVNNPGGYPQSEAAGPVARNPEYLNFYKQNLEVAVADTYQGKLTAEQLSAMKAGATQSLDDMVDAVKQLPEVAAFAASHPVLFGKAMAKAYTQMLTDNQRDTGEMLTNIALGLGGEAAATKAVEAIGKVTKTVKGALPVIDNTSLPKYTGGNGSGVAPTHNRNLSDVDTEFGVLPLNSTISNRIDFGNYVSDNKLTFKDGWSVDRVYDEIVNIPHGSRPAPTTYLTDAQIEAHLSTFDEGAIRFTSREKVEQYGTAGTSEAFVLPKKEFDRIVKDSNGNLRSIEKKLGLDQGYLGNGDTMAVYIKPEDIKNIHIPSGNEAGANGQWIPGGYTNGGVPEAIIDLSDSPFTEISIK